MLIFKLGVCPRISWDLTVNTFPLTWVETSLDPLATRYLKSWLGLTKSADPSKLFLPPPHGGLGLPSISCLYKKLQVGKAALLTTLEMVGSSLCLNLTLKKTDSQISKFKPATLVQQTFAEDPGASAKSLSFRSKKRVQSVETATRLAHATSLKVQGMIYKYVDEPANTIWSKAVQSLPAHLLKFALNVAQDMLPHNVNLARWRGLSNACKLCGQRQSLLHILNNCSVALKNRRYNQRHDLVLSEIHKFLTSSLNGYSIISDLANSDTYHIPSVLTFTDLRPDLVVFSETKKHVALIAYHSV